MINSHVNSIRLLTTEIIELVKRILSQHVKDNYKCIIQVISYSKIQEPKTFIRSECLWNAKTDDVLSIEIENDTWKFFLTIHGFAN